MKGLLLKDLFTLLRQMKFFLALTILFAILPGTSFSAFAVFYAAMLPMTALAYDERSKWNALAAMMPYSTSSLVFSKYLLGYLGIFGSALLSLVAQSVLCFVRHTTLNPDNLLSLRMMICVALLLQAVDLPFLFKMGVERGRLLFIALSVAIVLAGISFSDTLVVLLNSNVQFAFLPPYIAIITVVLNIVSVFLSIKLYQSNRS